MTAARATEIYNEARRRGFGPWSDQLSKIMTPAEREEVNEIWAEMSGSSCFVDALLAIRNGGGS